jgi:hypothetical protein
MEYLIGSFATIITVLMSRLLFKKKKNRKVRIEVRESQSMIFEMIKDSGVVYDLLHPKINTQATEHHEKNLIRIIFVESQAYWIRSNVFYTADLDEMGLIDFDSTRAVDTMTMSKVQLDKMSFIVEKLTEGK